MKLLLLNDTFFGSTLERRDIQILRVGPGAGNDICFDPERDNLREVLCQAGFRPDVVLQIDSIDQRVFFNGLEDIDAPRAFYAIDSPINEFWQASWAHHFDRIWVDQKATCDRMVSEGITWAEWLPLAADETIYHPPVDDAERDLDVVFVGTIDPERRPKRSAILFRLKQISDLTVIDGKGKRSVPAGEVADVYRRAKIVLNELLFDGVNLRTFEAMACGAIVLTEEGRGEGDLFADLDVMRTFNSHNLESVVAKLLSDPREQERLSKDSAEVIRDSHLVSLRARHVLNQLDELKKRNERDTLFSEVQSKWGVWRAGMKWEKVRPTAIVAQEFLAAHLNQMTLAQKVELFEATGNGPQALELLLGPFRENCLDDDMIPVLAALALVQGKIDLAGDVLGVRNASASDLHVAIGNRLYHDGKDLTPGFNRAAGPVSAWSAFEHYQRAFTHDENNLAALEAMDRILEIHHNSEMMLPLWQTWHARHPRDPEAIRRFINRAKSGYLNLQADSREGRSAERPFSSSSARSIDRTQSDGQTARNRT
ncbi:MAG: glycosyltransferase [bacterium]